MSCPEQPSGPLPAAAHSARPEREVTSWPTQGGAAAGAPTVTLGLLSDPGLPAELSADLAAQLPDPLGHETDVRARWRVETAY